MCPYLSHHKKISTFSSVVMFLMKLRLNLLDEDIAYRFRVHQSTVTRNFHDVLKVAAVKTSFLIQWPFDLLARAQVWSNYKHHMTLKFLIGITPQGTVSYNSKCAGGRMSDKEITETSGLMQHLLPGKLKLLHRQSMK